MDIELVPDCARCCGLCCVAPAFDADQGFGYDKPAHAPCRHLQAGDRCAIHSDLVARGFASCASFGCLGAGQRLSQQFFPGQHWRDSPEVARRMFDGYSRLLSLHELLSMIAWALPRSGEAEPRAALLRQRERIGSATAGIVAGTGDLTVATLRKETLALLRAHWTRDPAGPVRS